MTDVKRLHAAVSRILEYRAHSGCEIDHTDFCSCGLREAMVELDAAWRASGVATAPQTVHLTRTQFDLIAAGQYVIIDGTETIWQAPDDKEASKT